VALLRGINVGGKNMLPMSELVDMFAAAGCADVRTYIQSGNVVFAATPACARRIPGQISQRIEKDFGFRPAVIIRTAEELSQVVAANPFLRRGASPESLHVAFLLEAPARIDTLDPDRSPGDSFIVQGQEIYLCLPNGVGRTKLSNDYFESKLATKSTLRNWRTVLKLLELSSSRS
jgi:uncharacterized protein (DUF1697 family)